MRLFKLLPAMLLALVVFAAGCGKSEQELQYDKLTADQKELMTATARELQAVQANADQVLQRNESLRTRVQTLNDDLLDTRRDVEQLRTRVADLQKRLTESNAAIAAAEERMRQRGGGGFLTFLLIAVIIILIIYAIFRFLRSRSEFEDEDEDFADFEDDEDLGFDEGNDLEDDLDANKKKDNTTPPADNI